MRDINNLSMSKMENAWTVNNSMAHEPHSTHEATKCVVQFLDAKYEKADLQSVVSANCTHLSLQDQNKLLEYCSQNMRNFSTEHKVIGTLSLFPLN